MLTKEQIDEFEQLAKPLIEWLNNNANPHALIVIDIDSASVFSGEAAITTTEFIKD